MLMSEVDMLMLEVDMLMSEVNIKIIIDDHVCPR